MLVDRGAACHVCPPAWAHRMSPENKQPQPMVKTTEAGQLHAACVIRGPQPVRQDASLARENDNDNVSESGIENEDTQDSCQRICASITARVHASLTTNREVVR